MIIVRTTTYNTLIVLSYYCISWIEMNVEVKMKGWNNINNNNNKMISFYSILFNLLFYDCIVVYSTHIQEIDNNWKFLLFRSIHQNMYFHVIYFVFLADSFLICTLQSLILLTI